MGFAVPVALYFWLIAADGVDTLRADQWFDVRLALKDVLGTLKPSATVKLMVLKTENSFHEHRGSQLFLAKTPAPTKNSV